MNITYPVIIILGLLIILIIILYTLIIKYNKIEPFVATTSIPKTILQTYHDKSLIPTKVYNNIKEYAPDYFHIVFNDDECKEFIKKYYGDELLTVYNNISEGAHRADLFRYCHLYQYGGIYMDIKIELLHPFTEIHKLFHDENIQFSSVLSKVPLTIFQGYIATVPNNTLLLELIEYIKNNYDKCGDNYHLFTSDLYHKLSQKCSMREGINTNDIFLFTEKLYDKSVCYDGLDRHNVCSYITIDNEKILKTRYADYPWT